MPKSRPATWLEKEMMLNLIKKSGKKLDVDLDKCDYIRSSAGNLVCMFEDQPVFYVTKGCRLAMPPRPKKIKTSLRNKNLKKLAKKDAKKKAAHEKQVEKQREKMAQIAEQGKEEIDRSLFETVQDREKRMRWVKVIDEEAEKVNCGEMKFDIFPVFEDSLGSVRMRIVVQPKMDKKIGEIMPKQIPPQNWSDDMVRERIERVTQSDAFEIRLNKDVEYNLRASVLNYIKNNQALAIDTALISLMPHAEFFKFVRHIQKNGYILKPVELQKPMILPANGMVRFYIYDVMFTVSLDFKDYTDADWVEFVAKNEGVRTAEEMPLLEHRAVLILYPEEVKEYLKTASDEWKMYVDMMRDFASGHEREYWDMVHEMISVDEENDKESNE